MDRRQKKTRAAIFRAFHALLARKRYGDITVQEIIDEADVGRSTFYQHFETKDALLEALCTDLFDHAASPHPPGEATHDFSASTDEKSFLAHILYHLRDNRRDFTSLLSCESSDVFLRCFRLSLWQVFQSRYGDRIRACTALPAPFLLNHLTGSFVEMTLWWIQNGMELEPEELERYFVAVTDPILPPAPGAGAEEIP